MKSMRTERRLGVLQAVGPHQSGVLAVLMEFLYEQGANVEQADSNAFEHAYVIYAAFSATAEQMTSIQRCYQAELSAINPRLCLLDDVPIKTHHKARTHETCFRLRTLVPDRTGVLLAITRTLARAGVNVERNTDSLLVRDGNEQFKVAMTIRLPPWGCAQRLQRELSDSLRAEVRLDRVKARENNRFGNRW